MIISHHYHVLHNMNTYIKFDENPLISTQVIVEKWKYGHVMGR